MHFGQFIDFGLFILIFKLYQFPAYKNDFLTYYKSEQAIFLVINNFTLEKLPDARLLWEHPTTDIHSPISDKLTVMMTMVTAIPPKMLTVAMT